MRDFINLVESNLDNEAKEMALRNIRKIVHHLMELTPALKDVSDVEPWVLDKLSQAAEAVVTVTEYMTLSDTEHALHSKD